MTSSTFWYCLSMFLIVHLSGCTRNGEESPQETPASGPVHTGSLSLDWAGTYRGILPCADCEGSQTEIDLNEDMTYEIRTVYLGKEDGRIFMAEGEFEWHETGQTVTFMDVEEGTAPKYYKVEENRLVQLDLAGNLITGDLADQYILHKAADDVTGIYWELVGLSDSDSLVAANTPRRPHMILHPADRRISGNTGCNSFSGTFETGDGNRLQIREMISTKMACEPMETEHRLFEAFENTETFSVLENDTLSLNSNGSTLARFLSPYSRRN